MRLFFALWPPLATAQALHEWATIVQQDAGGRVTATGNIHLTLAFLGDADPDKAIAAARAVRAGRHDLPINSAKYVRRNEMVWVGPAKMPSALDDLVTQLHASLKGQSFALEDRPFAAHVTLIRKARQPCSIPSLPTLQWPAEEFVLVRSRTSAKGSTYERIERFRLDKQTR